MAGAPGGWPGTEGIQGPGENREKLGEVEDWESATQGALPFSKLRRHPQAGLWGTGARPESPRPLPRPEVLVLLDQTSFPGKMETYPGSLIK